MDHEQVQPEQEASHEPGRTKPKSEIRNPMDATDKSTWKQQLKPRNTRNTIKEKWLEMYANSPNRCGHHSRLLAGFAIFAFFCGNSTGAPARAGAFLAPKFAAIWTWVQGPFTT
jgi:hypothetical protein